MIRIILLLGSTALTNLELPPSVKFDFWQHKSTERDFLIRTPNIDPDDIIKDVRDSKLEEGLRSWKQFFSNFEIKQRRHKVFNYAIKNNAKIVDEKLDHIFNNLKCAVKVNLAFGFTFKNTEDGTFR